MREKKNMELCKVHLSAYCSNDSFVYFLSKYLQEITSLSDFKKEKHTIWY